MAVPLLERARRRIVALLGLRRMSQAELGRRVGISKSHMSEYCSPQRVANFPVDKLDEIAAALAVPTYSLFLDDPSQWVGRRDRRRGQRRSGCDRRQATS